MYHSFAYWSLNTYSWCPFSFSFLPSSLKHPESTTVRPFSSCNMMSLNLACNFCPSPHQINQRRRRSGELKLGLMHEIITFPKWKVMLLSKALTFTYLTVRQLGLLFAQWALSYSSEKAISAACCQGSPRSRFIETQHLALYSFEKITVVAVTGKNHKSFIITWAF